jgi:hypothetical protein
VHKCVHFTIGTIVIFASLRWANWKDWQRYYPTMIYMVACCLIYKFFALTQFHLWKFSSQDFFFKSHNAIFLWHLLIINPLCTFIYLSNFPENRFFKKSLYIVMWVGILILMELVLLKFNHINYFHGWTLSWTMLFDFIMFITLWIHYHKPFWAIILSIFTTLFFLSVFGYIT